MRRRLWVAGGLAVALAGCNRGNDANSVLQAAQVVMGNPNSIQYSGTGMHARFPVSFAAGGEWTRRELSSYTRAINYEQRSSREEWTFYGGQPENQQVNSDKAWTVRPKAPEGFDSDPSSYTPYPYGPDGIGTPGAPQLAAAEVFQLQISLTPHGFLKAAMAAGNATLAEMESANVISFTALAKYLVRGTIDANNLVTKVETAIANSGASAPGGVLGDMELTASYSEYRDFEGIQFPARIQVTQGGFPLWELDITNVTPNVPFDLPVPEVVQAATVPPSFYGEQPIVTTLADGVWHVTGGTAHSTIVEFTDYLAVVEAPLNDRRSIAVMAEAKKLAPNKPVRYVLTTHHHNDHSGGVRAYVAQGATLVTHQYNVRYFERVLTLQSTIAPDMLDKNPRTPVVQGVLDKYVITDGKQILEVYATNGDGHVNEGLLVYLPGPRILVEDAYSSDALNKPPPATPLAVEVALYDEIERLKLNVATIAPVHGRGHDPRGSAVPIAELRRWMGRR